MTQRGVIVLLAAVIVLVGGLAFAQPGPPPGPPPGQAPQMGPPPAPGLQLTGEQRTRLQALAKEERDRTHAARDQMQKLREQLQTELYADKPDEAKIKQLRGDLTKAQQEMLAARLDRQQKLAQVFTPEQRKQMREFRARQPFMRGPGGFPGPLPGPGFRRGLRGWGAWGPGMGWRGRGFGGRGLRGPGPWGPGVAPGPWWWRDDEK